MCAEEEQRMTDRSGFQTVGAATLKPREAKVAQTLGTDNRLVFAENVWECDNSEGMEISRLSGAESIVGQCGKFDFYVLLNRKPMKILRTR